MKKFKMKSEPIKPTDHLAEEIKYLIERPKERDNAIRKNREWISHYWIQDNAQNIFEIYRQVISRSDLILGKRNK